MPSTFMRLSAESLINLDAIALIEIQKVADGDEQLGGKSVIRIKFDNGDEKYVVSNAMPGAYPVDLHDLLNRISDKVGADQIPLPALEPAPPAGPVAKARPRRRR